MITDWKNNQGRLLISSIEYSNSFYKMNWNSLFSTPERSTFKYFV